ncbi:MAG: hypothetical protein HY521_10215 [Proteobacteria bacterium]|nr:hypothetical protein [Pseudomonadota bacterium]
MIVLLDGVARWHGAQAEHVIHWSRVDVEGRDISLPVETDRRVERIRDEYLTWVRAFGETPVEGRPLKDHVILAPGLSLWWMTLLAEKSPMKSPVIWQVFKLRALELVTETMGMLAFVYCGPNPLLAAIFRRWCEQGGRAFSWERRGRRPRGDGRVSLGRRVSRLPHRLQGLIWVWHSWWRRWRRIPRRRTEPVVGPTLVTYVPNLDLEALKAGRFRSHYWNGLHEVLEKRASGVNWVWLYTPTSQLSLRGTVRACRRLNRKGGRDRFFMLEEFLPARAPWAISRRFWRLSGEGRRLGARPLRFRLGDSRIDFEPLMAHDWAASLYGIAAAEAVAYAAMFERLAVRLPARPWGCYLWENQPWEQALVAAWRRDPKASVIANEHDVLKPLNLRLFADPPTYEDTGPSAPPLPHLLAVNGAHAERHLARAGFPAKRMVATEALRFQTLAAAKPAPEQPAARTLLLVTGYLEGETRFQLRLVASAARLGGLRFFERVLVKGHPFLPVKPIIESMRMPFNYEVSARPLTELFPLAAVAVMANSTGAVLDAAFAGVSVVVCDALDGFDFSPLRGLEQVRKVANGHDLVEALKAPLRVVLPDDFFHLDPELGRWRRLIEALDSVAAETEARP